MMLARMETPRARGIDLRKNKSGYRDSIKKATLWRFEYTDTYGFALKSCWQQWFRLGRSRISMEDRRGANGDDVGGSECAIERGK